MSHEIRTPMNAIIGFAHLLRRAETRAPQLDRLDKLIGAAKHLLSIINDILDLSKVEAGKLVLSLVRSPSANSSTVSSTCWIAVLPRRGCGWMSSSALGWKARCWAIDNGSRRSC